MKNYFQLKKIANTMEAMQDQKKVVYELARIEAREANEASGDLLLKDILCDCKYQCMSNERAKMAFVEEMHRTRKREAAIKYDYLEAEKQADAARKNQHDKRRAS
jgi:hypothetical protein